MTVKQFLNHLNIGRSTITKVSLIDVNNTGSDVCERLDRNNLIEQNYFDRGDCKINSFTITNDEIFLYIR